MRQTANDNGFCCMFESINLLLKVRFDGVAISLIVRKKVTHLSLSNSNHQGNMFVDSSRVCVLWIMWMIFFSGTTTFFFRRDNNNIIFQAKISAPSLSQLDANVIKITSFFFSKPLTLFFFKSFKQNENRNQSHAILD